MKTLGKILTTGAALLTLASAPKSLEAQATNDGALNDTTTIEEVQENTFNYNVGLSLENKSRFWGLPFVDSPHFKQNLGVNYGNLYLSLVGHVKEGEFFDLDTDLTYIQPLSDNLSVNAGVMRFDYDDPEKSWITGYVPHTGVSLNAPLNPSISYNHLIGFGGGDYIEGSVSESMSLGENAGLNLTGKLGYNMNAMIDGKRITHAQTTLSAPFSIKGVSFSPYINHFTSLSEDVENGFTGGVSVSKSF